MLWQKDVNQCSEADRSPLVAAVLCGEMDLVKMLIQKDADINKLVQNEEKLKMSAVHAAASSPSDDILTYLIQSGANLELKDSKGRDAFDLAKAAHLESNMKIIEEQLNSGK